MTKTLKNKTRIEENDELFNYEEFLENYWNNSQKAMDTQDPSLIKEFFSSDAVYRFRTNEGMLDVNIDEMIQSTLGYKKIQDLPIEIERIEKLENGMFLTIVFSSVDKKPYFAVSFFNLENGKIIELVEYYGDF
jgi:hypothetical protein